MKEQKAHQYELEKLKQALIIGQLKERINMAMTSLTDVVLERFIRINTCEKYKEEPTVTRSSFKEIMKYLI